MEDAEHSAKARPSNFIETRKFPRVEVQFQAEYSSGHRKFRHPVESLSGGGLFIRSPFQLREGTELVVRFRPTRRIPALRVRAKVRFTVPGKGFGVEFVKISRAARDTLLRLIHRRTIGLRKQPRVPVVAQIQFGRSQPLGWVRDISPGGLFVETDTPAAPGTQVTVRLNLPSQDATIIAQCVVTYTLGATGKGLQFVDISEENLKSVQRYIEDHPPRPRRSKAKKQNLKEARNATSRVELSRAPEPVAETPTGSDRNPEKPPASMK